MAATAAEIRERDLLSRLAAGTAGRRRRRLPAPARGRGRGRAGRRGRVRRRADRAAPGLRASRSPAPTPTGWSCARATSSRSRARRARTPTSRTCCSSAAAPGCATRPTGSCARTRSTATWRSRCAAPTAARSATSAWSPRARWTPRRASCRRCRCSPPAPRAELERRRHERALRARRDEVVASRARAVHAADEERRRIGRDLHDGAQQRLVVLGQALDLALRELETRPRAGASSASTAAREQARVAGRELRELARGLHPVGLERGLRGRAGRARRCSRRWRCEVVALPERRLPAGGRDHALVPRLRGALERDQARRGRRRVRVEIVQHGRTLVATVADDGSGGACCTPRHRPAGPRAPASSRSAGAWTSRARRRRHDAHGHDPARPVAHAAEPFLEFGHDGDERPRAAQDRGAAGGHAHDRRLARARVGARGRPAADRPAPAGLRPHGPRHGPSRSCAWR